MKRAIAALVTVLLAAEVDAQGAPRVNELTGSLSYSHPFALPAARGRFQPALVLDYSSQRSGNVGFGHGWNLGTAFVELRSRARYQGKNLPRFEYWLSGTAPAGRLLPVSGVKFDAARADVEYRPEVADGYFGMTYNPAPNAWSGRDGTGNTYQFACVTPVCNRWYLTRVTDPDQNVTAFEYEAEGPIGALTSSARLRAIRYNAFSPANPTSTAAIGYTGKFATHVELTYSCAARSCGAAASVPMAMREEAGSIVEHQHRLEVVRVRNESAGGVLTTVVANRLQYGTAADQYSEVLGAIAEWGGEFASQGATTRFGYGDGVDGLKTTTFSLAAAQSFPWPAGFGSAAWIDVDVDGRPDLAFQGSWARNVTTPGATTLAFEPSPRTGLPAWIKSGASASNADATELLLDMDGDGTLDLLNLGVQQCGAWPGMAVRFGTIGSDHNLSFAGYTCIDTSEPVAFWGQQTAYQFALRLPETAGDPASIRSDVLDLTGDGFLDVVIREVPPAGAYPTSTVWRVFPGFRDASSGVLGFGSALSYVVAGVGGFRGEIAGGAAACLGGTGTGMSEQGLVDINGDGISDRICFENTKWHAELNDASGLRGDLLWFSGGAVPGPAEGLIGAPTYIDACGLAKKHAENVALKDLNGDSLPDHVYYDAVGAVAHIYWNDGREFVEGTTFSLPSYPESRYQEAVASKVCPNNATVSEPARGVDATLVDADGDGTPDFVMGQPNASGGGPLFYRGSNASEAGRTVALRSVTVADGARFDIAYAPSSVTVSPTASQADQPGGGRTRGAFPVVRSVRVSGPALEANTIEYWYGDPWYRSSWDDASEVEFRGFRESWSKDAVTSLVSHTIRVTDSHAFMGLPLVSEVGPATGATNAIGAPALRTVVRSELKYGARSVATAGCIAHTEDATACGARHEPLAGQYPVVRFPASKVETRYVGATAFQSSTTTDVAAVDAYGNVFRTTVDPDLAPGAANDAVLIERNWYEPNPVCKSCDQEVDWRDPSATGAPPLQSRRYEYTATGLLVREAWSEKGVTRAYNGNGTLTSVTVDGDLADGQPGTTTTYTYDQPFQLRVAQEISTGTIERVNGTGEIEYVQKSIVRDTFYDSLFGRISQVVGPYLVGSSVSKPQVAYAFDDLGRVASISRSVPNGSQVPDAVQIFEYDDEAVPRATRAYRLAVAKAYTVGQPVPDGDDVALHIAYRDGLGRIVQVRERLGVGITAATAANVSESLTGFRVSGVRILDGAGRSRVELDPLYSGSGAYQEYRTAAPADLATVGVRGTVLSYDTEGRVKCSVYRPIIGALPPVPESCTPSTIDGAGHRFATAFTYQASTRDGGTYASVTIVPPESRGVTRHFDASGRLSITEQPAPAGASVGNRVRVLRDRLGRERATVRVSSDDSRTVDSSMEYRRDGRLWRQIDPSHGTREIEYDDAGNAKLVWLTQGSIERLRYKYGDLNRLTDVEEIGYVVQCDPGGGVCWQEERTTLTAKFGYDSPYNGDGAYAYTAGRRSYEVNAVSTIALGYDRDGRPERRDQWIAGVAGRLGTAVTHRADGAPTNVTFGMYPDASSVTHSLEYAIHYDSVGREVQLGGATTSFWAIPAQGGFGGYDASGRPGTLTADDGRATVTRTYSPFTGKMTFQAKTLGTTFFQLEGMSYLNSQLLGYTDTVNSIVYANTYDPDSGRLQQSTATATDACAPLAQDHDEQYGFNLQKTFTSGPSIGNVERVRSDVATCDAGGTLTSRVADVSYGYDAENADRLNSITPQGAGDISDALPSGSESFRWDLTNRLVSISRADGTSEKLAYAGSGELVRRQLGNEVVFYVGEHATVRGTLPPSCTEPSTTCQVDPATVVVDAHVLLRSTRIASVSTSRTLFYYRDHLGSVVATSLGGGHLGAQYRYTPYGKLDRTLGENVATASELGFTGGLKLSGDLVHLRARVYHPALKRFLSADVIELARYTYTSGDPVNLVDPSGLQAQSPQQECQWMGGYCVFPEQPVRGPSTEWSNNDVPTDPFDRDRDGGYGGDYGEGGSRGGGGRGGGGGSSGGGGGASPPSPKAIQAGVLDVLSPTAEAVGYRLAGGEDGWGKLVATVAFQSVAGFAVTSALIAAGPGLVVGIVAGAILGGATNVAVNLIIASASGDSYSGAKAAFDFGLGAVAGAVPGLMIGSAVGSAVRTTGSRVLSSQVSMQIEAGSAGWGAGWGLAQGTVNGSLSP